ncbi:hypothetical protein ACVIRM_000219 [Rhizobium laguerreae]
MCGRASIGPLHITRLSAIGRRHTNGLLAGLSARWKSSRGYLAARRYCEQYGNIDGESSCNSVEKVD